MLDTERRTQNAERRTQNAERRTQNPKPKTQNPKPKTKLERRPVVLDPDRVSRWALANAFNARGQTSDVKRLDVWCTHKLVRRRLKTRGIWILNRVEDDGDGTWGWRRFRVWSQKPEVLHPRPRSGDSWAQANAFNVRRQTPDVWRL